MVYEKVSAHSSIAASILTFTLTVLGFSDLQLTIWWHFLLAFVALIVCYIMLLILVELASPLVGKLIRPEPRVNFQKDYSDIEKIIHELHLKESQYETATSSEYKAILSREILLLSQKLQEKMAVFWRDSRNSVIKKSPKIPDHRLFELYAEYCEQVIKKHTPKE